MPNDIVNSLTPYHRKRNFKKSSEPRGKKSTRKKSRSFVIQQHAASHLHYDFRLEMNGVLKSWAVPKGPSIDPKVKRLAVHVEDHPIDYKNFEGIIPTGQYGAGAVRIWDHGEWEPQDKNVNKAYRNGHLSFRLNGNKLQGLWDLIRLKNDSKNWLLIKSKDDTWKSSEKLDLGLSDFVKRSHLPKIIRPQLLTLVSTPPDDDNWLHEVKFDGYRILTVIDKKKIKLVTRNGLDWTKKFLPLVNDLKQLKLNSAILDGELVAIDPNHHFDFQLLQNSIHEKDTDPLVYYVFDIIFYNGYDLKNMPLLQRKKILRSLIPEKGTQIKYSDHIIGNGAQIFKKACKLGLEGIVSKHIDSPYIQKRTKNWLKSKCLKRQEFVVCGYTEPKGQRQYFGSLLLGVNEKNKLIYCGNVGTGFNEKSLKLLHQRLTELKTDQAPFPSPKGVKNITWVKPKLIAEVEFIEWTGDKLLRHASYKGIRDDKFIKEIQKENPFSLSHVLTNPERILFPEIGLTKLELSKFYEEIQSWILPYIINRPLTLLRCPKGWEEKCFFQRHLHDASVPGIYAIDAEKKGGSYFYIKDLEGLLSLVQLGALEIHPWGCSIDRVNKPDVIIFDLDPAADVNWKDVVLAARFVRDQLKKLDLITFVKTTGGKGLHVTIPIEPKYSWDEIKKFTHAFAKTIETLEPERFTSVMSMSKRKGKIFLDYLRNQQGATAIAPYSVRARPNAPVATPLSWNELSSKTPSDCYTIRNLAKRLKHLKSDPWDGYFDLHQTLKIL